MSDDRCQSAEMDAAIMGDAYELGEAPLPCDGPRDMQRKGWWLCLKCTEDLDDLLEFAQALAHRLEGSRCADCDKALGDHLVKGAIPCPKFRRQEANG